MASASHAKGGASPAPLVLGRLGRPHGVAGAIRFELFGPTPEVLGPGFALMLRKDNAELRATVRELQPAGSAHYGALFRVRFEELEGRDVIAAWTGAEVLAERSSLEDLEEDEFYLADLIGRRVESVHDRRALGKVISISTNGAQDLLEIEYQKGRSWLLPVLPGFVCDPGPPTVVVDPPEGFLPTALESVAK